MIQVKEATVEGWLLAPAAICISNKKVQRAIGGGWEEPPVVAGALICAVQEEHCMEIFYDNEAEARIFPFIEHYFYL
jgi:hypothetical protein